MNIKLILSTLVIGSSLVLSGCTASDIQTMAGSGSAVSNSDVKLAAKNPQKVKIYFGNNGMPKHYKVIGHVTASQYSVIGTSYSQQSITDELKKQAASIGGTGVINVTTGIDRTSGDAIITR